ncbi:hypothetical protein CN933_11865 [Sinorhizobium sp. M4_45]|nr:hypothetical protein CN933_11865 [Sinorhizobium sp. M4_45]
MNRQFTRAGHEVGFEAASGSVASLPFRAGARRHGPEDHRVRLRLKPFGRRSQWEGSSLKQDRVA